MASIIGTIVNGEFMLVGLKAKGRHREFYGGASTESVEVRISLADLAARRLKTAQVDFSSGQPVLVGNFKLNSVPMEIYLGGEFSSINNEIEALGRVVNGSKDVGYMVKIGDKEVALPTDKIDKITQLMKPKNFVIRHDDSGKPYVAAKRGTIAELPVIADLSERVAKGSRKAAVRPVSADYTFMDILSMVASMNGLIAYLPGVSYKKSNEGYKLHCNFEAIEGGQLATPYIQHSISTANLNLNFRALGSVNVELAPGNVKTLYPSIYREKSVYKNGELAIETIGILVEKKHEATVLQNIAGAEVLTDSKILNFFSRIIGKTPGQISLLAVNLKGIKPYKNDVKVDYTELALRVNAYEQVNETYKQCAKLEREYLKKANGKYGDVHESLKGFSDAELASIALCGIDLKYYTYTRKQADEADSEKDAKATKDAKTTKAPKDLKIGWSTELSGAADAKKAADIEQIVEEVANMIAACDGEALHATVSNMKSTLENLKKEIWNMNRACLANGKSQFILPADVNGIKMVDATTARMKTSKKAMAELNHAAVTALVLTLNNATDTSLVLG